jgi:hypothetical protein
MKVALNIWVHDFGEHKKLFSFIIEQLCKRIWIFETECGLIISIPLFTFAFRVVVNVEHSLQHNFILF